MDLGSDSFPISNHFSRDISLVEMAGVLLGKVLYLRCAERKTRHPATIQSTKVLISSPAHAKFLIKISWVKCSCSNVTRSKYMYGSNNNKGLKKTPAKPKIAKINRYREYIEIIFESKHVGEAIQIVLCYYFSFMLHC